MKDLLSLLVMPIPVLYLVLILAIGFYLFKKRRTSKILFLVSGLWFLVISTNLIPSILVNNLEKQYSQISDSILKQLPDSFNIIVLGAGFSDDKNLAPSNQLTNLALGRLVEAIRIRHEIWGMSREASHIKIIMSGYAGRATVSQASVFYQAGLMLGLDSSEMDVSDLPKNTLAEASEYIRKFGKQKRLIIVTDATHMPRAIRIFTDAGVTAVPAPTNFFIRQESSRSPFSWIPSAHNIFMLELALHENIGMAWYKLRHK